MKYGNRRRMVECRNVTRRYSFIIIRIQGVPELVKTIVHATPAVVSRYSLGLRNLSILVPLLSLYGNLKLLDVVSQQFSEMFSQ